MPTSSILRTSIDMMNILSMQTGYLPEYLYTVFGEYVLFALDLDTPPHEVHMMLVQFCLAAQRLDKGLNDPILKELLRDLVIKKAP